MSQLTTIQTHVSRLETAVNDAEADARLLQPGATRDAALRALKFIHGAMTLAFRIFKLDTAGETDAVTLAGPVEK